MTTRTDVFSKLARDFARTEVLAVAAETPLQDTLGHMAGEKRSAAVVVDDARRPIGIVTEQDIVRRVALRADAAQATADIMTTPVRCIGTEEYLYYAVARMRRLGHRHMPVTDAGGRLYGILDLNDAMAHAAETLMGEIDDLTREDSIDGLRDVKAAQVRLARRLMDENLPVSEIQALLTHVNNDIYRRVVALALTAMRREGLGEPPVPFTVIVMGSGGRGENYIHPDQDNGFILDDYDDADHTRIDGWFIDLATRMTRDLDTAGLPFCEGHVMATNPLWRKRRSEWRDQLEIWKRKRNSASLRNCDIFFDFRPACGEIAFADELRAEVTRLTQGDRRFLREMCRNDAEQTPALGWFNRFVTVRNRPNYRGYVDLKRAGTMPLVSGVRLLALREGLEELSTLGRLSALHQRGVVDGDDHEALTDALTRIARLVLAQQIGDFEAGRPVVNYIHPASLSKRATRRLKEALRSIERFHTRIRFEFAGEVY